MKYVYPAVFSHDNEGYYVHFPDIEGCFTDGDTLAEAIENANDVLPLMLCSMEDDGDAIPEPSDITALVVVDGDFASLIYADTLDYRRRFDAKAVKKTLSIPNWLNTLAEQNNINFSNVLQNALMDQLHIER
jgi:predicted RNase H-like HicB family nuclease